MAAPNNNTLLCCVLFFITIAVPAAHSAVDQFTFNGFSGADDGEILVDDRVSILKPGGALRLTSTRTKNAIGHAFHTRPIRMLNRTSPFPSSTSFATTFVFSIISPAAGKGGFGLAFVLAPSPEFPGAAADHYLGLFNSTTNDGDPSNHVFAIEFDTVNGVNDTRDTDGNHVGINVNSMNSNGNQRQEVILQSGDPIQAWVEYDAVLKRVDVTVSPAGNRKPIAPLLSESLDLTPVVRELMYAGFSASTGGEKASAHYILGWSFSTDGNPAPPLNISLLPSPPPAEKSPSPRFAPSVIALISALCAVTVVLFLYKRVTMRFEALEDWELECPHRFRYRDLYSGTRGFSDSEMIGIGGFGAVYRAIIPNSGSLLAVKKITPNSIQGIREFAAEIESLGRLRHKNLVNLQGWCKQRSDLLLVYDYIPNGSLDFFLYGGQRGLSWEQRFRVLKGIAAGLLYLHEEWEQVVIHRDVKSSNVLIDGEMNGRLGDFGLARLYSHGTAASHTTNVVGTVGYIAPELARTGKASTRSDVFAFGVLLLETASGRRPIGDGDGDFILVDWVTECLQMGSVLDSADARLERRYVAEEMEMVLGLGLICSHQRQESRPTMRQVVRYLNCEDQLPTVDRRGYTDDDALGSARRANSRLLEVVMSTPPDLGSADMYSSSSISGGSTSSIYNGR
ncbi:unnamed protein product [Linum tenue]|uniref:non-specific serine/threonine protein kinase n=1 Tax=Linum tenue TaxID=586396 RepID=A0AAV0L493_9ROSI|nr:unnamed protein product [Linum tenue]